MSFSFVSGSSRHPGPRQLHGSKPGLLDPTQSARLLRTPTSTLSFAAFDPLAAFANPAPHRKRSHDTDPARPKRIVIETTPGSRIPAKWRFVPRARRATGVEDEGVWPRLVHICGEPFILSEDQWDIYKLDPIYDCFVPAQPNHPIITRKDPPPPEQLYSRASSASDHAKKRRLSTPPIESDEYSANLNKKFRTAVSLITDEDVSDIEEVTESDEEVEVEEIVVETETPRQDSQRSERAHERRKAREERTRERREKIKVKTASSFESTRAGTPEIVDLTMEDSTPSETSSSNGGSSQGPTKRKGDIPRGESPDETSPRGRPFQPNKRARAQSPGSNRVALNKKRAERERRRLAQYQERMSDLRQHREQRLWENLFGEAPLPTPPPSQHNEANGHNPPEASGTEPTDEAAQHETTIEESRRKLAELERDRPLWEEEAKKRARQEQLEKEARRLRKEEARLRAAEAAAQEEQQRMRAEAAAAETERKAQAEKARRQHEREQRRRKERERWSYGLWTNTRAIERYKALADEFDAAKFTQENPVDFESVPWPVLESPVTLRLEDIDWSAVEAFFEAAKKYMRTQDYKAFVEKSHKRFHPDRWRARGILKSVEDDDLRGCLEVAATTVAQALTPIWRTMRG
ncbi:hypothetical protein C8Q80DRAFT_1106514 [Daedaleopsis nitida]|nr:hypothetical protein C8Q80DRAFT_1106514 [Daedaleopsis nitida]